MDILTGEPEAEAVLGFLRRVAESAVGDDLSRTAKRVIRSSGRRGGRGLLGCFAGGVKRS